MTKDEYARLIGTIDCVRDDVGAIKVDMAEVKGDVKLISQQQTSHEKHDIERFNAVNEKLDRHEADDTQKVKALEERSHDWRKSIALAIFGVLLGVVAKWLLG